MSTLTLTAAVRSDNAGSVNIRTAFDDDLRFTLPTLVDPTNTATFPHFGQVWATSAIR